MDFTTILKPERLDAGIKAIIAANESTERLDGWFFAREIMMECLKTLDPAISPAMRTAEMLNSVIEMIPLSIRPGEIFAGTEADSFSRSYALINPAFKVQSFEGYCDEDAVYNDITPDGGAITRERIETVRKFWREQPYAKRINEIYEKTGDETREVIYFVERVTGHTVPDFASGLRQGLDALIAKCEHKAATDHEKSDYFKSLALTMTAAVKLAARYSKIAAGMADAESDPDRRAELQLISATCARVPAQPATNLYEAIQSYITLWQVMNLEQTPNPYAFSVGNLDRTLQPYFGKGGESRELATEMIRHLLAFFCVGDRNWAISQNIMIGGMDTSGNDLTCDMSYVIIEAFDRFNYSQPNLSVKVHPATPEKFYQAVSDTMFKFGHSTPSFFNDPVVFKALAGKNVEPADMPLYGAAGCQEPLVMGMESANTTNSWLNLAKILELTLNDGKSLITGKQLAPTWSEMGADFAPAFESVDEFKTLYYRYIEYFTDRMVSAANGCTEALATIPVPFHSAFMGAIDTGIDMRDTSGRGIKYSGSGCLIHGLGTVADSINAIRYVIESGKKFDIDMPKVITALRSDFEGADYLRDVLRSAPKYGNGIAAADAEARELQEQVSVMINSRENPMGRKFAADWSTPSTNMLYGYWTGATPNGRKSRAILSYGVDPEASAGSKGLLARVSSQMQLNYGLMTGGSAAALSINPDKLTQHTPGQKADYLRQIIHAIFGFNNAGDTGMMYAYFNVYSPEALLDVVKNPQNYPDPVIVRIHGQYGDARHLSPDVIIGDVIPRLDPMSTAF